MSTPLSRRQFLGASGLGAIGLGLNLSPTWASPPQQFTSDPILHILNRLTFGARPEEVAWVGQIGLEAYLEGQLNPATLDNSALEARLQSEHPILFMDRRQTYQLINKEARTEEALIAGTILRNIHSQHQLLERMVEFWSDHFNMPSDYSLDLIPYHKDVLRPHALGNFRDLLFYTAQSPAMLFYLDNYLSDASHPNENYARELLELHTLGVDGGYTEQDVKEVARALTGWTVNDATPTGFYFDPSMHDTGPKTVLGHSLAAERGIEDGLQVLSIVANHPMTARFVCYKLCVRFVSDAPSSALVEGAAQVWAETRGEIKPVLRYIFSSEEFLASAGLKLRRPLDFFIAALRATGTTFSDYYHMLTLLEDLGQVPYGWLPPNGYPDVSAAWKTTNGLLARWNAAFTLTHTAWSAQYEPMETQIRARIGEPANVGALVDAVAQQVYASALPDALRQEYIAYVADGGAAETPVTLPLLSAKLGSLYGMMLAAPAFQWH